MKQEADLHAKSNGTHIIPVVPQAVVQPDRNTSRFGLVSQCLGILLWI
jgi:hypothetical protein